MEKAINWEQINLINVLNQGKNLASQLRNHLNPSSPIETRHILVEKILSSYEKALSMLNFSAYAVGENNSVLDSSLSLADNSPRSDVSAQDCKGQFHKDVYKKRKTQLRWTEQVKVCSGTGLEGPRDDGYSWRKYGQKDILGAAFPRAYYRCTHRHSQGCLAIKQVQRSDEDPTIFEVTYRGRHTCIQASHQDNTKSSSPNDRPKQNKCQEKPKPKEEVLVTPKTGEGLKVLKTECVDARDDIFPPFSFSIGIENEEINIFNESLLENSILGSLSPTFLSPATSESNYFSMSPPHLNNFAIGHAVQTPESDPTEILSAPTSVTNSPMADFDMIKIDSVDFDYDFSLDNLEFSFD